MKNKKEISRKSISMFIFTVPATVLYCIFFIYPIAIGIMYSFTDWKDWQKILSLLGLPIILKHLLTNDSRMQYCSILNSRFWL